MVERGDSLIIFAWTLTAIATAVVSLRFWVRITWLRRIKADDYCMLLALCFLLIEGAIIVVGRHYGFGEHIWTLSPSRSVQGMKYAVLLEVPSILSSMWGRISFAAFLILLLGPTAWIKTSILWAVIGVQAIVHVVILIQIFVQCGTHPSALWNPEVREIARCQSPEVQLVLAYVQSALNSLCDLILFIIPAIIVWQLTAPPKTKAALSAVLTLSIFALAASIWKCIEIRNLGHRNDFTWNMVALQFSVVLENSIVIIGASVPTLSPLWRRKKSHRYTNAISGAPFDGGLQRRMETRGGIYDGSKQSSHRVTITLDDEKSKDCILQEHYEGIVKSTDVHVAYDGASQSSRSEEEIGLAM